MKLVLLMHPYVCFPSANGTMSLTRGGSYDALTAALRAVSLYVKVGFLLFAYVFSFEREHAAICYEPGPRSPALSSSEAGPTDG